MGEWQVFIADASDMTRLGEVTSVATNKQLQIAMNKAGSFSFTMPMGHELAENTIPSYNCIILQKNKVVVWSGPCWTREYDFDTGKINVSAVGWFQILHKRYNTYADFNYTSSETDGAIVASVLNYANAVQDTWISLGSNTSTSTRDNHVVPKWSNLGEEIENLTTIEAGLDFEVDPVTRDLNCYAWDDYEDNGIVFAQNWGPSNATGVNRSESADELTNDQWVVGQTAEGNATDAFSAAVHNLHQNVIQLNEVDDVGILGAIANAEVAVNASPRTIISFTPKPTSPTHDYPVAFEDYNLRDKIYLNAERDGVVIQGLETRVFGLTIQIDELGNERIGQMQTTYQSA